MFARANKFQYLNIQPPPRQRQWRNTAAMQNGDEQQTAAASAMAAACHADGHALDLGGRHQCKKAGNKMAPGVWCVCVLS
jgi:hypothetical protein